MSGIVNVFKNSTLFFRIPDLYSQTKSGGEQPPLYLEKDQEPYAITASSNRIMKHCYLFLPSYS